uniref:Uncharacterized protein n=1 Tax=Romanomermis culicivorax TaxID=13658 RepID=A0A915J7M4_ROMCU
MAMTPERQGEGYSPKATKLQLTSIDQGITQHCASRCMFEKIFTLEDSINYSDDPNQVPESLNIDESQSLIIDNGISTLEWFSTSSSNFKIKRQPSSSNRISKVSSSACSCSPDWVPRSSTFGFLRSLPAYLLSMQCFTFRSSSCISLSKFISFLSMLGDPIRLFVFPLSSAPPSEVGDLFDPTLLSIDDDLRPNFRSSRILRV